MAKEADITIGSVQLMEAQAMAVRVAVTSMLHELQDPKYRSDLGEIAELYQARLGEVQAMISRDAKERMELEVTFREYSLSTPNPETGGQERGEYHGSFTQWFRGGTPAEILELATQWAKDQSAKLRVDVRVWEMPVTVTPRGVVSR